ncbi:MAG TPA: carbon-nitrogen hydrolase [Chthoniobacteraceae bacterium]|jgi:N-carbamoylputrescine amidase|nr:carbon-nitrogen hydrolase [Chthoniobacteraceae bacterium]
MTPVLGIVQMRCGPDLDANLAHACDLVRDAARRGANVICLPELFRSQYFCQVEDHKYFQAAEEIPGPSTDALGPIARELGVVIVASLFERRAPGLYHNTAAILDADGSLMGKYRKMHIPDDPLFYEKFYFAPGDLGFQSWKTKHAPIGVCVCWDQWYPEAARLTALRGAQVLFYPTAIGWHPAEREQYGKRQHEAWETIQRSHAIANGCYVAVANRIGHEAPDGGPGLDFWGQSFIVAPDGAVLARAGIEEETILVQEIDLKALDVQRTHWPFLRDRRIDAYSGIGQRMID